MQELNISHVINELRARWGPDSVDSDDSVLRLYLTDDNHHTMIGFVDTLARDSEGTRSRGVAFSACTCPQGFQSIALSIAALKPRCCHHVDEVMVFVSQQGAGL